MALINCLECSKQISSTAKACPHCGNPVVLAEQQKTITPLPHFKKKNNKRLVYGIVAGVILVLFGVVFFLKSMGPSAEEQKIREEQIRIQDSLAAAESAMKEKAIQDSIRNVDSIFAAEAAANAMFQQSSYYTVAADTNEYESQKYSSTKNVSSTSTKKSIRNNWSSYIKVERSAYTYREIGGIEDLYIKVTNNTDYTLDIVEASISYLKTNGQVYKTETVYFYDIPSHSWMRNKAPDSDRGTSVDYLQIISIQSSDLNFCYAPGNWAANSPDPYKCE